MGFQAAHAVDDLRAGPLEIERALDVAGLVEPGFELHQGRDMFLLFRGPDEGGDDGAVFARPVEDLLDGQNVRVVRRFTDQALHGIEAVIGMEQEDVLSREDVKNGFAGPELRKGLRCPRLVLERLEARDRGQAEICPEVQGTGDPGHPVGGDGEDIPEDCQGRGRRLLSDFEANARALFPFDQDLLHFRQEVRGLVLADGHVRVPDDPERDCLDDRLSGEEPAGEPGRDILEEDILIAVLDRKRDEPGQAFWQGDDGAAVFLSGPGAPLEADEQVDPEPGQDREGPVRRYGDGRQNGQDLAREVAFEKRLRFRGQVLGPDSPDPGRRQPALEIRQARVLILDHLPRHAADLPDLDGRREPREVRLVPALGRYLLQPAETDHEELVQVRTGDGQELEPLEQREVGVESLFEDAPVEGQPAQLAVKEWALFSRHEGPSPRRRGPRGGPP